MKIKAFLAVAVSSALLSAVVFADDTSTNGQSLQTPSDNMATPNAPSSTDINNNAMQNGTMPNNGTNGSDMNNNTNNNDEGSPDAATGDDDY